MKIYVVMGSTGEYSDRDEWMVVAYEVEQLAKEHVIKATARANEIFVKGGRRGNPKEENEFDARMWMDYTGTGYSYAEVELVQEHD